MSEASACIEHSPLELHELNPCLGGNLDEFDNEDVWRDMFPAVSLADGYVPESYEIQLSLAETETLPSHPPPFITTHEDHCIPIKSAPYARPLKSPASSWLNLRRPRTSNL